MKLRALLPVLVLTAPAGAVTVELREPTDNELRAAYCAGYLRVSLENIAVVKADLAGPNKSGMADPKAALELAVRVEREMSDRYERLRGYLLPKASTFDADAFRIANERGRGDYSRANDELASCYRACEPRGLRTCMDTCFKSELQQRTQRCSDLGWLPF
jgi:hypothetical protein